MRLKALNLAGIRQIFQLGIVVVLFLAAVPLFSAGRADPLLSRADGLVKEKRYNEALRILTEFIREDDIRFDSAQYRIREILKKFDDYNHLVNELVNVIEQTPEDYETIVFLADKLRELDAPRDEETRLFVNHIQELARFTIN
ncbi:MAG: hypothetical protein LBD22_06585, partial [Spirochaetaceae bacterium]|nr:hypothetical protein [Spirochaetaceae bacterium]